MNFRASAREKRKAAKLLPILGFALASAPLFAQSKPTSAPSSNSNSASPTAGAATVEATEGVRGTKLVLKNGTYQLVSQYKVIGDRVRYYSIERAEWEEIPASLVDWAATKKANAEPNKGAEQAIAIAHNLDIEEHPGALDVNAGLGLPPGVLLPPGQGVFAFDGHKILKIKQDLATSKLNKGRFIATLIIPVPVLPTRYTVFLKGKHADTQIDDTEPVFFYRFSGDKEPEIQLLRAKVKGKQRQIEFLDMYFGQKETQTNQIPVDIRRVHPDTYRLSANQDLSPGEYVIAQEVPGQGIDLYVWDFSITGPQAKPEKAPKKHK